jgi:hypothetical protein
MGRVLGAREMIIAGTKYFIPYRAKAGLLEILWIYRAARRWPSVL